MRRVGTNPPCAAGPQDALLLADVECHLTLDHEAALLVWVAMLRDHGVRGELNDREGHFLALDAAGDDSIPHLDRERLGEIDQVRHPVLRLVEPAYPTIDEGDDGDDGSL
jgi:hypothetical protein